MHKSKYFDHILGKQNTTTDKNEIKMIKRIIKERLKNTIKRKEWKSKGSDVTSV